MAAAASPSSAVASDWQPTVARAGHLSSLEVWLNADVTQRHWSTGSGLAWAPFGTLAEPGWRLRLAGGGGRYDYRAPGCTVTPRKLAKYKGSSAYGDALAGYQWSAGPLTTKLYAGVTFAGHLRDPADPAFGEADDTGVKLALETWLTLPGVGFLQSDGEWASVAERKKVRVRLGYDHELPVAVGLEAEAQRADRYEAERVGAFVRHAHEHGEASLAVGASFARKEEAGLYLTLGWLTRY
jgi:hypothetical protein